MQQHDFVVCGLSGRIDTNIMCPLDNNNNDNNNNNNNNKNQQNPFFLWRIYQKRYFYIYLNQGHCTQLC